MKARTKALGLEAIKLDQELPETRAARVIGGQIVKSSTSVGANYRAACRARSRADFIGKLKIVEEETDETIYWLEVLVDAKMVAPERVEWLLKESNEILAIIVSSINTSRGGQSQ